MKKQRRKRNIAKGRKSVKKRTVKHQRSLIDYLEYRVKQLGLDSDPIVGKLSHPGHYLLQIGGYLRTRKIDPGLYARIKNAYEKLYNTTPQRITRSLEEDYGILIGGKGGFPFRTTPRDIIILTSAVVEYLLCHRNNYLGRPYRRSQSHKGETYPYYDMYFGRNTDGTPHEYKKKMLNESVKIAIEVKTKEHFGHHD